MKDSELIELYEDTLEAIRAKANLIGEDDVIWLDYSDDGVCWHRYRYYIDSGMVGSKYYRIPKKPKQEPITPEKYRWWAVKNVKTGDSQLLDRNNGYGNWDLNYIGLGHTDCGVLANLIDEGEIELIKPPWMKE
jgi:hypothetical protein